MSITVPAVFQGTLSTDPGMGDAEVPVMVSGKAIFRDGDLVRIVTADYDMHFNRYVSKDGHKEVFDYCMRPAHDRGKYPNWPAPETEKSK